eukprot:3649478-Rhodomonas_salina.9
MCGSLDTEVANSHHIEDLRGFGGANQDGSEVGLRNQSNDDHKEHRRNHPNGREAPNDRTPLPCGGDTAIIPHGRQRIRKAFETEG